MASIAGIAAESKLSGVPIADLRQTAGEEDYEAIDSLVDRLMLRRGLEQTDGVHDVYIQLWEARVVALMSQPHVWNAVESLVYDLQMSEGSMGRTDLTASIKRGMEMP